MRIKLLALLLVAVLLLAACAPSNLGGTETTAPSTTSPTQTTTTTAPTQPTEPPIPTPAEVIDGTYIVCDSSRPSLSIIDPELDIGTFFRHHYQKDSTKNDSIEILHTTSDGTESTIKVEYNASNKNFQYTEGDVSQTYDYIVYAPIAGQPEDDFDYLHIVLLSNKPDATYLDTLDQENPEAVIIYARFVTLEKSVESYGDIPTIVKQDGVPTSEIGFSRYLTDSYFMLDYRADAFPFTNNSNSIIYRYDYSGNLLCSVKMPGSFVSPEYIELSDGGFLLLGNYNSARTTYIVSRFDADGKALWTHESSEGHSILDFHLVNNTIYCFGRLNYEGITATTLSLDGEVLSEGIILEGSYNYMHVVPEEDGFGMYVLNYDTGKENGIRYNEFYILFDFELKVVSCNEMNDIANYLTRPFGFLDGKPIFANDPIFKYHSSETFPEEEPNKPSLEYSRIHPQRIFAYQDGYIIVRYHDFGSCYFTNNNYVFYYERIFTYYDSTGTPQWQYVSPVYLI